jgi:DNA-binding transcriptional regulator YhcF (GntR family)
VPERLHEPMGLGHPWGGFYDNLTDEQREAVQDKIKEMRDQDATREEIHTAVAEILKSYGVDVPENWPGPHGRREGFWKDLTKEQRESVEKKIKEMKGQDATPEEIHTAVAEMLKSYGIEVPDDLPGPPEHLGFGHPRSGFWGELTDEQREAIREKTKQMRDQDASPEEIHSAVAEMLKGYGIEVPENWAGPHGRRGFGPGPGGFFEDLTKEQREAVREKIKELRSQGATRQEIRETIDQMLEGFGVESPENSESMPAETTPAEIKITAGSYPNPFNPETQINYSLATSGNVRIQIYNISGQLIRKFDMGYQSPGSYSVRWDGRNESGDITASGVYLYRIEAGSYNVTNRMVLLK